MQIEEFRRVLYAFGEATDTLALHIAKEIEEEKVSVFDVPSELKALGTLVVAKKLLARAYGEEY